MKLTEEGERLQKMLFPKELLQDSNVPGHTPTTAVYSHTWSAATTGTSDSAKGPPAKRSSSLADVEKNVGIGNTGGSIFSQTVDAAGFDGAGSRGAAAADPAATVSFSFSGSALPKATMSHRGPSPAYSLASRANVMDSKVREKGGSSFVFRH